MIIMCCGEEMSAKRSIIKASQAHLDHLKRKVFSLYSAVNEE